MKIRVRKTPTVEHRSVATAGWHTIAGKIVEVDKPFTREELAQQGLYAEDCDGEYFWPVTAGVDLEKVYSDNPPEGYRLIMCAHELEVD